MGRLAGGFAMQSRMGRATPGAHFRHVLDHYERFLEGLAHGRVDYHERRRNPEVESNPEKARAACRACREQLLERTPACLDVAIWVRTGSDPTQPDWAATSVKRELAFCASHTLHHLAIVKMMAREMGVDLDEDLGVAPSTASHRRATQTFATAGR